MRTCLGRKNTLFIHLTYAPYLETSGEVKTKPTQHSVKELRGIGIQPDIVLCRTANALDDNIKAKISLFCNVEKGAVVTAKDVECIYELPLWFQKEGLDKKILENLHIWAAQPKLSQWEQIVDRFYNPERSVDIAIVGKYVDLTESYKSLNEALCHGGLANNCKVNLHFIDSETITDENVSELMQGMNGILIPGGFGCRGVEGKITAIQHAREKQIPFFGICLGMQAAVIEFARNVAGLQKANSQEFDKGTPAPVIHLISEWFDHRQGEVQKRDISSDKGGTMRLGAYPCCIDQAGSLAGRIYKSENISERHRHRYEFNNQYRDTLMAAGLVFSGQSPDGELVEIVELDAGFGHPWFLGCQFHP
jgi:CTP synthase